MEKAPSDWGEGPQRAGSHIGHIAALIPTIWTDFRRYAAYAGGEESSLLHSGTQRRGETRKEIINSYWRTETDSHSPANRKAAGGGGMPPTRPSNPKHYSEARVWEVGGQPADSISPISLGQEQRDQLTCQMVLLKPKGRLFVFKSEKKFDSMSLPSQFNGR